MDVYEELVRWRRRGRKCALATVVEGHGSIPGYQSAKMLVRDDGSMVGTVGGGAMEAEVSNAAREVIETEKPKYLSFTGNHEITDPDGMICGGRLSVYIEPVVPSPRAFLFGAGHVAMSLAKVAGAAGFEIVIIDDRSQYANRERFPRAEAIHVGDYEEICPKLEVGASSYILIATRGHRDDLRVLRWAVTSGARYVAMIGSRQKVVTLVKALEREGTPPEAFAGLAAPMGLDIGAVTPGEIAVSVVAEMIAVRRQPASKWRELSLSLYRNPARPAGT